MTNYTQQAGSYIGQTEGEQPTPERSAMLHVVDNQRNIILETISETPPQYHNTEGDVNYSQQAGSYIGRTGNNRNTDMQEERPKSFYWNDKHRRLLKNYEETFQFSTLPDGRASEHLRERNRIIIPSEDGTFREFIIDEHVQNRNSLDVYCTGSFLEMKRNKPLMPATFEGQTINTIADTVLFDTEWERGITEGVDIATISFEEYITPYDALRHIADTFDLELRFRVVTNGGYVTGRYVDFLKKQGTWRGREIVSGKDLVNAKRTEKTDKLVTALIGLGPEREDGTRVKVEVTNEAALQNWGRKNRHLWGTFEADGDKETLTEADVREQTEKELERLVAANVQYEVEGIDLEYITGWENEKIRLGDNVRVKATEYNPPIYLSARIIGIEGSVSRRSQKTYTLGEFIEYEEEDVNALRRRLLRKISNSKQVIYSDDAPVDTGVIWVDTSTPEHTPKRHNGSDWDGSLRTENLAGSINTLANAIEYDSNFYWQGGTMIAKDPYNSDNIVRLSALGIGISNDGGNSYTNNITGDGLLATRVNVKKNGTLIAELFEDANGGLLVINDDGGQRNVKIGVEGLDGTNTGGTLILYDDSISRPRIEAGIVNGFGRMNLRDSSGIQRVFLDSSSPGIGITDDNENIVTTLSDTSGKINNEEIATQDWVTNNYTTSTEVGNEISGRVYGKTVDVTIQDGELGEADFVTFPFTPDHVVASVDDNSFDIFVAGVLEINPGEWVVNLKRTTTSGSVTKTVQLIAVKNS